MLPINCNDTRITAFIVCLLFPMLASAHSREAAGLISGFTHPLFGLDHLLAMLGVGLISARITGHYIWSIPCVFVAFMVFGGTVGANGVGFPMVEWGIALSVCILGCAIVLVKTPNTATIFIIMSCVAFFGFLHGHAHGVEMPRASSSVFYSIGFVISTSMIHILGVFMGHIPNKSERLQRFPSYVGSFMTVVGCYILYGLAQG